MRGTLASSERSVDVTTAIDEVQRALSRAGTLRYEAPSIHFPCQIAASLVTPDGRSVGSRGKGLGLQGTASALFELLEHAVSMGIIERIDSNARMPASTLYDSGAISPDYLGRQVMTINRPTIMATPFHLVDGTRGPVWLPAALYDEAAATDSDPSLELAAHYWSSNGYAAGMTVADASLHALNEVIERDAFSNFLLAVCHERAVGFDLDLGGHPIDHLRSDIEGSTDSHVVVRVLPALAGTVCIAIGSRSDYHGRRLVGLGSSGNPEYAVERALLEYEQECAVECEFEAGLIPDEDDDLDQDAAALAKHAFFGRGYLLADIPPAESEELTLWQLPRSACQFVYVARQLAAAGYPVLRRTLYRDARPGGTEIGPTVVQVAAIGAEKFHLVRLGLAVEPIGRLRRPETITACRTGGTSLHCTIKGETMLETVRDRELALLTGRWGAPSAVRGAALPWFEAAAVSSDAVSAANIHPLLQHAAEAAHGQEHTDAIPQFDQDALANYLPPSAIADRRLYAAGSNPAYGAAVMAEVINERIAPKQVLSLTDDQLHTLHQAIELLYRVIPDLAADALSYLQMFALTDRSDMIGETWMEYPGLVLFGPAAFETPKVLAESLFHESLHSKTVWLERGMNKLKEEDSAGVQSDDDDKPIQIPWRRNEDKSVTHWSTVRTYDAFYVYVHLTVLASAVWESDSLESDLDQLRRICFRAAYLSNQLRNNPECADIGTERHEVIAWLDDIRVLPFDLTPAGQKQLIYAA